LLLHLQPLRRRARRGGPGHGAVAAGLLVALATLTALAAPLAHRGGATASPARFTDPPSGRRALAGFVREMQAPLDLAPAAAAPAPPPPAVATGPPLRPHEIFGFAPYWTLDISPGFDVHDLTTIAYFGLTVGADGSLQQSGDGWDGYGSQELADLISRAHAAGTRVVLTVTCFDDTVIHRLTAGTAAADRLAAQIVALVRAKNMDGANLDVEGTGSADRAAYAAFAPRVARTLHAADPHWQVSVDTYAGSAANPDGFFDVAALAPAFDAMFVMAYDMYGDGSVAGPNAPLDSYAPNDTAAMAAYTAVVPPAKVLLGTPFYGYDWQVRSSTPNAATASPPQPQTYADIVAAGHSAQWDARGSVPFTTYRAGDGSWHETYFDDPHSLALKAQLVSRYRLAGLGVWALGMDGNDPAMMAALLGHAAPLKYSGAPSSSASPSRSATAAAPTASPTPPPSSTPKPTPKPSPTPSPTPSSGAPPPPTAPPPPSTLPLPTPPPVV
jgi:hypothetical protein